MVLRISGSVGVLVAMTLAAGAEPVPPFIKNGDAYVASRDKLKQAKWLPFSTELREEGACPDHDDRCKNFPEARECSGTGVGSCNMVWKHEDGAILVVTTAGEEDLTIVSAGLEQQP